MERGREFSQTGGIIEGLGNSFLTREGLNYETVTVREPGLTREGRGNG